MIGTRGVPAQYGGFETAVEEVGTRLAARGHDVRVYCRNATTKSPEHQGMRLVHLPALKLKAAETLSHSLLSTLHQCSTRQGRRPVALVFNAANSPFVPMLQARGIPTILHLDGLEWKRSKWGRLGSRYYLAAERFGVRVADALIADAVAIQRYYLDTYDVTSDFIAYGAPLPDPAPVAVLQRELGLTPRGFYLVVARTEPENHVLTMVRGYAAEPGSRPLVVVGSAPYADRYMGEVADAAARDPRVRLLGGVWDQRLLDALYVHCAGYLHGHSVGGTNPSLLRAMGAGAPVTAVDVTFNREVLGDTGRYFPVPASVQDTARLGLARGGDDVDRGARGRTRAQALYDWDRVAAQYESLCYRVSSERPDSLPVTTADSVTDG